MQLVHIGSCVVPNVVGISVGPVGFDVGPIQSPNRILAFYQCLSEVVFFLFQQMGTGEDSLGSVCQGVNDTEFSSQVVVTVPLQVQICMCGLSIHSSDAGLVRLWHHQCVQERNGPIFS